MGGIYEKHHTPSLPSLLEQRVEFFLQKASCSSCLTGFSDPLGADPTLRNLIPILARKSFTLVGVRRMPVIASMRLIASPVLWGGSRLNSASMITACGASPLLRPPWHFHSRQWIDEVNRRRKEVLSGKVETIDGDDVAKHVRNLLRK